ncbi:MAG TPA: protein phosphatase 2C domain-containing protein [Syntrophorhabdaceae bacterium]
MDAFGMTDRGVGRQINEDCIVLDHKTMLYMVADGMGGHVGGGVASRKAVSTVAYIMQRNIASYDTESLKHDEPLMGMIKEAIHTANREIYEYSRGETMGTTLSIAHFSNGKLYIAHIGDSRIYRVRKKRMEKLTEDHTEAHNLGKAGLIPPEKVENHRLSHVLTRALGSSKSAAPDIASHAVEDGDVYLICSDGLFRVMGADEVGGVLAGKTSPEEKCTILMREALRRGAPDNVSLIVVEAQGPISRIFSGMKRRFMLHKERTL